MTGRSITTTDAAAIVVTVQGAQREPRVDSRSIAAHLGIQHATAIKTIQRHRSAFSELGILRLQVQKFSDSGRGRPEKFAMLNEDQAYLLLTMSRNTPRVVALKVALVKAFRETRMALEAYRAGTVPTSKAMADAVQAVPGGPGPWLHSNINKLVNKAANIAAGGRGLADAVTQAMLMAMQAAVTRAIAGAKDAKEAYALASAAVAPFEGGQR